MQIIIYIIPFITPLFLLIVFNKKMVWWEYLVLRLPSLFFTLIAQIIRVSVNSTDTEYLGGYVNRITYYEPWDELVTVTHTREVACGTDSNGNTIYKTEVYHIIER